jgi:dTDP-4-amino-4,6-dideoxygalactose transaminase
MQHNWKITLSDVSIGKQEQKAVRDVLKSNWFTMGEVTQKFEALFKQKHRAKHAIAVTNCTAALHLANVALGINKGDHVICPSLTFVATANSILYAGARPVFADIVSENNITISPDDIEKKITRRTKAIIVVHYAGFPCDMKKIMAIAGKHNLKVIEDCAHAPLTMYQGHHLGTYGDVGVFSFFSNKNMTTAEGGMLVTHSDSLASKIRLLRSHAMTSLTLDRHRGHSFRYDVTELGFNYRIDEIRSSIGLIQLGKLQSMNQKRRILFAYYQKKMRDILQLETLFHDFDIHESACHIFPVLLKNPKCRNALQRYLKSQGIQTSIHYHPIHQFSFYKREFSKTRLPITEDISSRLLTLPLSPNLKKSQVDFIIGNIKQFFKSNGSLTVVGIRHG